MSTPMNMDAVALDADLIDPKDDLLSVDDRHFRHQAGKWTQAVRHRLPDWITQNVQPLL